MISLPKRRRGKQTQASRNQYAADVAAFCDLLRQIESTVDFKLSARGMCYMLEEHGLLKGDFDVCQRLINDCRKDGSLPIHFTADDQSRGVECKERNIDSHDPDGFAEFLANDIMTDYLRYYPKSFWDDQEYYIEMMVEKVDLKSLFTPTCRRFNIPIANAKGWSDINSRGHMMKRFAEHERKGRQCVLLYCGDHDPGGLNISDAMRSNLSDLADATGWCPDNLIIDRFGLNYDFIMENKLSWIENLETASGKRLDDTGHKDHYKPYVQSYLVKYGARKVEANALVVAATAGRQLCLDAITRYISADAPDDHNRYINEEQEKVRELIPAALEKVLANGASDDWDGIF